MSFLLAILTNVVGSAVSDWLLATGSWNDGGVWNDGATWNDGA